MRVRGGCFRGLVGGWWKLGGVVGFRVDGGAFWGVSGRVGVRFRSGSFRGGVVWLWGWRLAELGEVRRLVRAVW